MKTTTIVLLLLISSWAAGQSRETPNLFIITTDGFRWQEVFSGADSSIINNPRFVKDTSLTKQFYWSASLEERRKKLLPFFWNVIAKNGQLYGNRTLRSKVNVKNIYKISYPGYNELLTGYADPRPVLNTPTYNPNISILEWLNDRTGYEDRVVAFSSWNIFPFLLNRKRNDMLMNSGYQVMAERITDSSQMITKVQNNVKNRTSTRYDLLTYLTAKEYIQNHRPRVVYISFGETDVFAHNGQYDLYLQQANNIDKMIAELWYYVQTDPFYKNNTNFVITTDHGRGSNPKSWRGHNGLIKGSGEIWLALLGNRIEPVGEMKDMENIFQNQLAATVVNLLDEKYIVQHKTGKPIQLPGKQIMVKSETTEKFPAITEVNPVINKITKQHK